MKNLGRLILDKTIFFNCDIQTGFSKHIFGNKSVLTTARTMAQTSKVLDIPVLVTE